MKQSAGLLIYRRKPMLEVLLIHPGGPFWKAKDAGAWSIPKGELEEGEEGLMAAIRETKEETGQAFEGDFIPLTPITQKNKKTVYAWALEAEFDVTTLISNTFPLEWPPKSGKIIEVPEADRAVWFDVNTAREKINAAQWALVEQLENLLR